MNLFQSLETDSIRKNDSIYINSDTSVVRITDTNINEFYITAYVVDKPSPEAVIIYRYRNLSNSTEESTRYESVDEILHDIRTTDSKLMKLHLLEVLFYTWGFNEETLSFSDIKFDSITVSFALYSRLISIRLFNNLFVADPVVFTGDTECTLSDFYKKKITVETKKSLIPELLSYRLYRNDPQPWITICSDNENRVLKNSNVVKDSYTIGDVSEMLDLDSYPNVPLYKFSMFELKQKTRTILDHVSGFKKDVIITSLSPCTLPASEIPDNVTFINSAPNSDPSYDYCITSSERIPEGDSEVTFFSGFENDENVNCIVNGGDMEFLYSSSLVSVLNTVDPHIHHKSLDGFIETAL